MKLRSRYVYWDKTNGAWIARTTDTDETASVATLSVGPKAGRGQEIRTATKIRASQLRIARIFCAYAALSESLVTSSI